MSTNTYIGGNMGKVEPFDLTKIAQYPVLSVDVETTGLHWYRDKMFAIAAAGHDPKTGQWFAGYWDLREKPAALGAFKMRLPRAKCVVNHFIKFDSNFLLNEGIVIADDAMQCTGVRASLINEHETSFSLDALGKKYAGQGKVDIYRELAGLFGGAPTRGAQMRNLHRAPSSLAGKYAIDDPVIAIKLWLWQEEEIKRQGLEQVWGMERRLTPVLAGIERHGIRVDVDRTVATRTRIQRDIERAQARIRKIAGPDFNANSAPQTRAMFKPEMRDERWYVGDVLLETTGAGAPSIGKDALRQLAARKHPLAQAMLDVRKLTKAVQFFTNHILEHEVKGRVYPNYNQTKGDDGGVGPGRLSMSDPALQQIPKRDEDIAEMARSCYLPEKGQEWMSCDWDQFEFRWFAHYTEDPKILGAYDANPDTDYHKVVSEITGIPRNATHAGGANAKQINLGLVFGMGQGKMASEMGLPYTVQRRGGQEFIMPGDEAAAIFKTYHTAIPGVRALLDRASSLARSRGYVFTAMGRHIRFPGGQFTHKAGGLVFQGTSADCMKQKMIELAPVCKEEGIPYLLSVHDEHNFSVPKSKRKTIPPRIKEILEVFDGVRCPIKCDVPIRSSVALGPNWWEACR